MSIELINRYLKPAKGTSVLFHYLLILLLPIILFILVRLNNSQFTQIAIILVFLSKWRMLAVRPRFWPVNIRANLVDILVGVSIVLFMTDTTNVYYQIMWVVLYAIWLLYVKPGTTGLKVAFQAGIGQILALSALFVTWNNGPNYGLSIVAAIICYLSARHFFDNFEEDYSRMLSYMWSFFGLCLVWLLGHWLLYYSVISQPVIILTIIGYVIGSIYYLDHKGKLTKLLKQQLILLLLSVILLILIFSNWGSQII